MEKEGEWCYVRGAMEEKSYTIRVVQGDEEEEEEKSSIIEPVTFPTSRRQTKLGIKEGTKMEGGWREVCTFTFHSHLAQINFQ